jgi:hypothetical protein
VWTTTKILAERKRVTMRMSDWVIKLAKREGKVNHVIISTDLKVKWHRCSNLSLSYGSRLRHIHRAQVWVVSCVLYSWAVISLEFLLMSPRFNSFLLLRDEQNSKWGGVGGVGGHKMHIFTTNIPTFHSRYRKWVLITNEFHEFCWSIISGTSNNGKAPYGPKTMYIFIMSKIRHSHRQYDTGK